MYFVHIGQPGLRLEAFQGGARSDCPGGTGACPNGERETLARRRSGSREPRGAGIAPYPASSSMTGSRPLGLRENQCGAREHLTGFRASSTTLPGLVRLRALSSPLVESIARRLSINDTTSHDSLRPRISNRGAHRRQHDSCKREARAATGPKVTRAIQLVSAPRKLTL